MRVPPWFLYPCFFMLNGMAVEGQMRKLNDNFSHKIIFYWGGEAKSSRGRAKFVYVPLSTPLEYMHKIGHAGFREGFYHLKTRRENHWLPF